MGRSKVAFRALLLILPFLATGSPPLAFGFDRSGCATGECRDCHQLSAEEATRLLAGRFDRVAEVGYAEVPGLWALEVEKAGRRFTAFLSFSRNHLFLGPPLSLGLSPVPQRAFLRADVPEIPLEKALIFGRRDAPTKVVVFTDPLCQLCRKFFREMEKTVADHPDIAFWVRCALPMEVFRVAP